jgi:hypothetical protein
MVENTRSGANSTRNEYRFAKSQTAIPRIASQKRPPRKVAS